MSFRSRPRGYAFDQGRMIEAVRADMRSPMV